MRRTGSRRGHGGRARIALYGHDTCGLGHLRRNLALAATLTRIPDGADVLVVTGSPHAQRFARPAGVDLLVLPSVCKDATGGYSADALDVPLADVVDVRAAAATAALVAFDPDLFVVDKTPTGFRGELLAALKALRVNGTTNVLGLRDVLDSPDVAAREWRRDGGPEAVATLYDEVWVYGDADVHDVAADLAVGPREETAAGVRTGADAFRFLGYLAEGRPGAVEPLPRTDPTARTVLATVGGGVDGAALTRTLLQTRLPVGVELVLLPGPFADEEFREELTRSARHRSDLHVVEFTAAAAHWMATADAVIAMGGYNTVTEILATATPALVVPRTRPRREQLVRARSMARRGLLDLLPGTDPGRPTAIDLAAWIRTALQRDRRDLGRVRAGVDRDGLDAVRSRAAELLGEVSLPVEELVPSVTPILTGSVSRAH